MVLMFEGHFQHRQMLMRNAKSTLELGYEDIEHNGSLVDGFPDEVIPTFPKLKKGHKRSTSDVTQLYKAQTLPHGFVPTYNRTNSTGSSKKSTSFFAGIANKVKTALEGKPDASHNKNVSWALRADEFGTASSDSSPNPTRRTKYTGNSKSKRTNGLTHGRRSPSKLTVPESPWPTTRHASLPNSNSDYTDPALYHQTPEALWASGSDETEKSPSARNCGSLNAYERLTDRRFSNASNDTAASMASNDKFGDVNILVMGAEGVGKSALIVRYLTKRFIGEYAPNFESVYDQAMHIDGKDVNLHVWDSEIPAMLQKPSEKGSKDADEDDPQSPRLREALSITSLTSSVVSSISSTSSTYGCRFSNSSIEEEQFAKTFGPAIVVDSSSTPADKGAKRIDGQSGKQNKKNEVNNNVGNSDEMQLRLSWCDGMVVVYSICDPESFEAARDVIRFVRGHYVRGHAVTDFNSGPEGRCYSVSGESSGSDSQNRYSRLPILLIGNKSDLEHRRRVDLRSLHAFTAAYGCTAAELSVSDGFEPVSRAFNDIVDRIRKDKVPSRLTKIKSIVKTVSGTFGHRRNMSM